MKEMITIPRSEYEQMKKEIAEEYFPGSFLYLIFNFLSYENNSRRHELRRTQ
jgi:hypothetical protein